MFQILLDAMMVLIIIFFLILKFHLTCGINYISIYTSLSFAQMKMFRLLFDFVSKYNKKHNNVCMYVTLVFCMCIEHKCIVLYRTNSNDLYFTFSFAVYFSDSVCYFCWILIFVYLFSFVCLFCFFFIFFVDILQCWLCGCWK